MLQLLHVVLIPTQPHLYLCLVLNAPQGSGLDRVGLLEFVLEVGYLRLQSFALVEKGEVLLGELLETGQQISLFLDQQMDLVL